MSQEIIIVHGNGTLSGDVQVSGAKNSALKLMAASLLGRGRTVLHNVPLISDIEIMSRVLTRLGATVERDGHTLVIDTAPVNSCETPYELVSKMRASISVLGPLIGRFGEAHVAMPGGCQIGARKIDMHLVGLEALGDLLGGDGAEEAAAGPGLGGDLHHQLLQLLGGGLGLGLLGGLLGLEGVGVGQQLQAQDLVEAVQRRPLGGVVHAGLEHIVQGGDPQRGVEIVAHRLKEVVLEPLHGPLVHHSEIHLRPSNLGLKHINQKRKHPHAYDHDHRNFHDHLPLTSSFYLRRYCLIHNLIFFLLINYIFSLFEIIQSQPA